MKTQNQWRILTNWNSLSFRAEKIKNATRFLTLWWHRFLQFFHSTRRKTVPKTKTDIVFQYMGDRIKLFLFEAPKRIIFSISHLFHIPCSSQWDTEESCDWYRLTHSAGAASGAAWVQAGAQASGAHGAGAASHGAHGAQTAFLKQQRLKMQGRKHGLQQGAAHSASHGAGAQASGAQAAGAQASGAQGLHAAR